MYIYNWKQDEEGEKNSKKNSEKTKEKTLFGSPPLPPSMMWGVDCFPVSKSTKNKLNCAILCLSVILRLPKGGLARAKTYSTLNLSPTLIWHPAWMPDGPANNPYEVDVLLNQSNSTQPNNFTMDKEQHKVSF